MNYFSSLHEKGYLTEDEFVFLRTSADADSKRTADAEKDSAHIDLRLLILQEDYGISSGMSEAIARMTEDEDIDRIHAALMSCVKPETVRKLLRDNPELFLLNNEETEKYVDRFVKLMAVCRIYDIRDFDPDASPYNFSSLDALSETRRRLDEMVREASAGRKGRTTEIDRIKSQLAGEGFDPDITMTILHYGFWFNGQYFTGNHRIRKESFYKNVGRKADIRKSDVERELSKLLRGGAVLGKDGFSLNAHPNELENAALSDALKYVLGHLPAEENCG